VLFETHSIKLHAFKEIANYSTTIISFPVEACWRLIFYPALFCCFRLPFLFL